MAAKYQLITELYRRTGVAVAKNPQAWQGFLSSACRNYKCRFDEQLLIYAQRPDAVAVAKLETWNRQFRRWVNKDSKGIAVFDPKGRRNTLKYYFDVSDTHEGYYGSRPVPIWQMDERYEQAVMERLSDRFGDVESTDLASALMETAKNAVEDNLQDYYSQLRDCTKDSFLEELDDFNIEVIYRRLAANSVAFMLISRCGLDTNEFFDREDFADIVNFNTPATINAIGIATSDIAEMALREISQSVRNVQIAEKDQNRTFAQRTQAQYDKGRQQPERSEYNERNHLQQTGGLSYSRPNITDRARASAWQVRFDAQGLSGEAQTSDLSQPADIGQAERASARGRADSTPEVGASDEAALSRAGRDRGTERESSDAVGRTDEQHPQPSGGSDTDRTDLQVSVAKEDEVRVNLPTVDEQIEMIAKAEDEKASAFAISKEDIDSVLQKGSGVADGKYRIYRQFQKGEDRQKNIEFLKNEYGTGGGTHIFPDGFSGHSWHDSKGLAIDRNGTYTNHDLVLKWSQVEKRLRELIKDNRYLNPKEKNHYADYLESVSAPQYEIDTQRKIARQRFIDAHRDLPPADKRDTLALRLSDFIRDLDRYEKDLLSVVERSDLADVTAEQMEQHLSDPSTVQQLIDFLAQVQWKTTSVFSRSNGWKFTEELRELHPLRYLYNEGDVVYIGADKYEIATLTEEKVYLQNAEFPILGQEYSRADFEENFKRKADMFTKRTIKPHREVTSVETASEALALSIGEKARVDLPYMEQLTGKTQAELVQDLQGVIFKVPNCEPISYVAADEYLSGNVRNKLTVAELAAKNDPELAVNVEALKKVIPKDLSAAEISVRLGATWIPQEDIQRFVMELLTPSSYAAGRLKVRYTPINGDWFIENKSSDMGNVKADSTYGTKRASAYRIIEDTLNLRDTRIFDYVYDEHGNKKAVFNAKETTAAQAKQEVIKQAFQDWIWKDPERRNRLVRYYNDTFNSVRPREYDGSHITFGGISPEITLRPHQVNAIAHILYGGNTLLAHKVGAGKTFEMVAAAQESKRLGLCQKSMFVVPNHLVGQWASEYLRLYPSANILVTTKQDFETGNRKKFCGRIATGDYDAVIIGHSQFEKIPMSIERQREQLEKQLDDIERGIDDVQASKGEQFTVKQLMKTRKAIKTKLEKLNDTKRKDTVIDFEQLGVDRLFIDESHFYKNLYLYTKMRNVGGIAQTEAQKSSDLFMKCRYLDEITGNRGTVFATGTPVSNSMVELYSVQRYLQYDTLAQNGLQHFDSWASTFGETVTALELAPEGTNYRAKTRFAKFYNLPELMQMFREVADIQTADMLKLPVPKVNYHNIKTKPSEIQTEMVASLAKRAEKVRARLVEPNIDNMLKITNDGRKLALDQRMIDPMLPDAPDSKVNACVDNVYRIWEEHADTKATQLVFCDLSTPKNDGTFNVYDDMREKLIARGIPAEQIRFIHEATTDAQKKELFGKVRSGEVRVLFGSTPKMGAGTNVQDRLIAIHNLDCPWRPSDLEQRQGRIERQGNMFPEVEVYRYVTEQTFDAYLYQLVESKQKFISQIMTSKSPVRSAEDVDEVALSFAEVKMLATGDARFKEKMDLDIQVSKLRVLKQSYLSEHYDLEDRVLKYYPQTIKEYEERIAGYENDAALAEQHKPQGEDKFCPMTLKGVTYTEKADAGEMLLAICKDYPMSAPTEIGSYRGFRMEIYYDIVNAHYCMNLCGKAKHKVDLGADALGNPTRIENELSKLPARLEAAKTKKAETIAQLETAKEEIKKPFAFEDELKEKTERLNVLNIELNLNEKDTSVMDTEPEQTEEQPERKCASRER